LLNETTFQGWKVEIVQKLMVLLQTKLSFEFAAAEKKTVWYLANKKAYLVKKIEGKAAKSFILTFLLIFLCHKYLP
jgi:hypothetical protein